ncbi:DUF445 family protein [Algiphilus sp. W345]|uniref:DUF445 family protein n=1 Tax=Banduia mediterranea TaxID=3075609 RepID=A0ABU2WGA3_9GAMM|nr:DUF445 family protein [Algiphilus sp. W345]MDT0496664.1 DUF445 family protein [Algiphilus sp. W345]
MSGNLVTWDRWFRYGLIVVAVVLGSLDHWLGGNLYLKSGFVIAVAGLVGYFTNYLAIKMLFQPKRGQVLGWRGLVPRNQAQIARSLAHNVQRRLLAPDIVIAYIRDRKLIDLATTRLAQWLDANLQEPAVRRQITALVIEFLNTRGPALLTNGFDLAEDALKRIARDPGTIERYWQKTRAELVAFLEAQENRGVAAQQGRNLLQQQLPQIAAWLDRALEAYLADRRAVGGIGRGLKNLVSFDQDAILHMLQRFTDDPRFIAQIMEGLDAVVDGIQRELEADSTQTLIHTQLDRWIGWLGEISRKTVLPATIEQIDAYFNNADNWPQIEETLIQTILWLKGHALKLVDSPTGQAWLRAGIESAVQHLNVTELVEQQVMELDTDELEKMVLDNTGGNLTVIQLLGGLLGIVAGTVQVHILFALPLAAGCGVVWCAYAWNEYRHRAK